MGNLSLYNYETDYWVAHTCYPSFDGKNRISYRLHHIVIPSPTHVHTQPTYAVFLEEQECHASFNDCVRWMFAPAYLFTWKGPILVMTINSSDGQVADCEVFTFPSIIHMESTWNPWNPWNQCWLRPQPIHCSMDIMDSITIPHGFQYGM